MSDVVEDVVPVEGEAPLKEGDADWRPWSGGHESPLEALWQWMVSKGVGGLKAEEDPAPPSYPTERDASADSESAPSPVGYAAVDAAASAGPEQHD